MSTSIISGNKIQTNEYNRYNPKCSRCNGDGCGAFKCSAFTSWDLCGTTKGKYDWNFLNNTCALSCPAKPFCSKPNPQEGNIGLSHSGETPLLDIEWGENGAPEVKYFYDVNKIDTAKQIENWVKLYGENKGYNTIMQNYCALSAADVLRQFPTYNGNNLCETTPDGIPQNCSILKSNSIEGQNCRNWFEAQKDSIKDAVVKNYCLKNNTVECKCLNRYLDPIYNKIKPSKIATDSCWYVPCASTDYYFLSSELRNPKCPEKICEQLYNFINDNKIDLNEVTNSINCNDFNDIEKPPKPQPPPPMKQSFYFLIFGGIIMIILIIFKLRS